MNRLIAAAVIAAAPAAFAQDDEDGTFQTTSLKPEAAIQLAQAAMESCREQGFQVGVAVVNRSGVLQVFMKDRFAGAHTIETARRKAWTAVSFRTDTHELDEATQPGTEAYGIRFISEALPLGGGLMIESGGSLIGGVGVSGAPGTSFDVACAEAGIEAIEDLLGF